MVQRNPQEALVEYLQHELLDSLFKNKDALFLSFIGGTAIRILLQSHRFSIDKTEFIELFSRRVKELDLKFLAKDVEPFLFSPGQKERILTFREYWGQFG